MIKYNCVVVVIEVDERLKIERHLGKSESFIPKIRSNKVNPIEPSGQ